MYNKKIKSKYTKCLCILFSWNLFFFVLNNIYTIPLTCNVAVYLVSDAGLLATHVYSPECVADKEGILRSEEYWSNNVTFAPSNLGNGSPSLSQRNVNGGSPLDTPHTVRVRIPSASPSWKEKGSIIGGTRIYDMKKKRKEKEKKTNQKTIVYDYKIIKPYSRI